MAVIVSTQDGKWSSTSTWSGGAIPTISDDVYVHHNVVFNASIKARAIYIEATGSLSVSDDWVGGALTAEVGGIYLKRTLNDNRRVNFDGVILVGTEPCITSTIDGDSFPRTPPIHGDDPTKVIFDDPGFLSCSAEMQDIKPEGVAHAYARKVRNMVRYMTLTLKIKNTELRHLGVLYRMAQGPFQVLAVTHSCLIKGHIEAIVPDPSSVGKAYVSVKVTIAEGPGA